MEEKLLNEVSNVLAMCKITYSFLELFKSKLFLQLHEIMEQSVGLTGSNWFTVTFLTGDYYLVLAGISENLTLQT